MSSAFDGCATAGLSHLCEYQILIKKSIFNDVIYSTTLPYEHFECYVGTIIEKINVIIESLGTAGFVEH